MITHLRDLLISYWKKQASNQIKLKKSKLLIYDEYLNKYVRAEELLIPGVKVKNKGAVTNAKSKELFVFDVLFKKFVNPKLDLLVPGVKGLDVLMKNSIYNKQEHNTTLRRDYFWGKKTSKKHAVYPLPTIHSKTCTETEPPQVGWAGQQTRKPVTDPRPELGQPECMLGPPGKDPKKKKPPKKKSKKKKLLVCSKVKQLKKNMEDGINKRGTEETTKENSKGSEETMNREEKCYSDSKEYVKQVKSQDLMNIGQSNPLKSVVKQETLLENVIKKPEKNKTKNSEGFKIICSKLFSNEVNVKDTTKAEVLFNKPTKTVCTPKADPPLSRNEKSNENSRKDCNENKKLINNETDCKSNKSKALLCKPDLPSSLVPTKVLKTTNNIYLCKEPNSKSKNKNLPVITESSTSKTLCPPGTPILNDIKCDKVKSFNTMKKGKDKDIMNSTSTCVKKVKDDVCNQNKTTNDSSLDTIKKECKKTISNRVNTSTIETPDSSTISNKVIKCDKMELFKCTKDKDSAGNIDMTSTCFNKAKIDDCKKPDSGVCTAKIECKKTTTNRPNTSPIEPKDFSKVSNCSVFNSTQSNGVESKTLSYNLMERPKTAGLQNTCPKTSSLIVPGSDCKNNELNIKQVSDKPCHSNEEPYKCGKAETSKMDDKCNKTNDKESLDCNSSKCLNIDPNLTEKLQRIAQEELFKRAESSPDLTKCNSYLGFKVKKASSKAKAITQINLKVHTDDCKKTPPKKSRSKSKNKSKTALKTCQDDSVQSKTDCNSFTGSKSESFLNEKEKINNTPHDLKEVSTKSTCTDIVSFCNIKDESKSTMGRTCDSKHDLQNRKNKLSHKKSSTKTSKKCKSKSSLDIKEDNLKSTKAVKKKSTKCPSNKEQNNKLPTEKSNICTAPSAGFECKDTNEITNYDTVKDGSSCKNQIPHGQDEQVCCKTTEKEIGNVCSEKNPNKETVECPVSQEKTKQTAMDKNKIEKHKSKETHENKKNIKSKDYLKHIITGATQRKKTNLLKICKKVTSLQSVKSQSVPNKIYKNKKENSLPKKLQTKDGPLKRVQKSKSSKNCSEKKSSTDLIDKRSKKSKSKQSVCLKTAKDSSVDRNKQKVKPQTVDKLTKLNKLVRRAKCRTANQNPKKKVATNAVICSKSTPSIHPTKVNKISGVTKPNGAITNRPSTSSTRDNNFKNIKGSRNENKNAQMCSLQTLRKRMAESPIKTTKGMDVKSFSELKILTTNPERKTSANSFNIGNHSSKLDLHSNEQKIGRLSIKSSGVTEECKLEKGNKQQTEGNNLKINDWCKQTFIDIKNKHNSPSIGNDKHFRLLLTSMTHETETNKHSTKDIKLNLSTNTDANDQFITPGKKGQPNLVTKSSNNINEYSNDRFKILQDKNKFKKSIISLLPESKDNNLDLSFNKNNTNRKLNLQTKDTRLNEKEITNPNQITNKGFKEKLKGERSISGERTRSLFKGVTKETYFTKGFHKEEGAKNQTHQATVSQVQLQVRDTPNIDIKTVNNRPCTRSATLNKSVNNALSAPQQTLGPCKIKSTSSLNALELEGIVAKNTIRPLQSLKQEKNKDLEIKTMSNYKDQPKNNVLSDPQKSLILCKTKSVSSFNALELQDIVAKNAVRPLQTLKQEKNKDIEIKTMSNNKEQPKNNVLSDPQKTLSPCKTKSVISFNALELQDIVPKNAVRPFQSPKKEKNKEIEIKSDNKEQQKNNALSAPPKTFGPCKTKTVSSLNALELQGIVAKNTVRPLQSIKQEKNKELEIKTMINNKEQPKDNVLSDPQKILCSCKTKSVSSFNALELQDIVAKNTIRPFQSPNKEKNKELEIKTMSGNKEQQKNINATMPCSRQNKLSDKSQLQFTKIENATNSSVNKILQTPEKRSVGHELLVHRKLPQLKENESKHVVGTSGSMGVTNVRKNSVSNEKVLCDVIESSSHVKIQDIQPQYSDINANYTSNPYGHLKKLTQLKGIKNAEQTNKTKKFINVSRNYLKDKDSNIKESNTATKSTLTNKTLIIAELEKHVTKLEKLVPSIKRMFKPVYLKSKVSENENQETSKKILAAKKLLEDKTTKVSKVSKTVNNATEENNDILQKKRSVLDETVLDRTKINNVKNVITPNNTEKCQQITLQKLSKNIQETDLQKREIENQIFLSPRLYTKTLVKSKYSPTLKTKLQLISKRHRTFKSFQHKKTNEKTDSTVAKIDIIQFKKLESKETNHAGMSNKNHNREQTDNNTYSSVTASLSSKQSRLLMQQPFYKKPKSEPSIKSELNISKSESSLVSPNKGSIKSISSSKQPARQLTLSMEQPIYTESKSKTSTDNAMHKSKSDSSFAPNKDNTKGRSSNTQPAKQLKLLTEQPFYKQQRSELYTEHSMLKSNSKNNLPKSKQVSRNELHSAKSETKMAAQNTNKPSVIISPRKQASIRSLLQRKTPSKAVIQVNSNNNDKD